MHLKQPAVYIWLLLLKCLSLFFFFFFFFNFQLKILETEVQTMAQLLYWIALTLMLVINRCHKTQCTTACCV